MTTFLKIVATIIFCLIWGSIQRGCQTATSQSGSSGVGYLLVNLFGLALLIAGIIGIWKYNPNKGNEKDNSKLNKS